MVDKEEIIRLLPEIDMIEDSSLAAKIIAVWRKACSMSANGENLSKIPFYHKTPDELLVAHTRKVVRFALALSECASTDPGAPAIKKDILLAACLLHDVDKVILQKFRVEDNSWGSSSESGGYRHGFLGAKLCMEAGVPESIIHIVETHTVEAESPPKVYEGVLMHYADFLAADTAFWKADLPLLMRKSD